MGISLLTEYPWHLGDLKKGICIQILKVQIYKFVKNSYPAWMNSKGGFLLFKEPITGQVP